ncbi:MAG: hypothetical protein M0Q24_07655 [Sulfurimonas sp.]|uniref:type II restriction enzyme n=1 Tax=Sulfurimonas sp. TaxID=2022749 RepID=UPI0025EB50CA|nr:hypothetical protein [Sulfurimonas sp.]MCK9491949.1 hypothetical protein [Sulfurimonas sp.]
MSKISKKDQAWDEIFHEQKVLDKITKDGYFDITANCIKEISKQEPRLITKIDFREELPHIMAIHGLSILAIKNGLYKIAKNDPFIDIKREPHCHIKTIEKPNYITTIDPLNIKSESAALDIAKISGMLDLVFKEQTELTIRGRLRGSLEFSIGMIDYEVDKVQIEVDGGYEGATSVNLVESKIGFRNNINIRQLLYPELMWKNQRSTLKHKKNVNSFVFYYQDDLFRFLPFKYDGSKFSVMHEREEAFRFKIEQKFSLSEIKKTSEVLVDYNSPFPQANDFEKVHAILLNIENEECPTKISIISNFDVVDRQANYYFSVLEWLKLCRYDGECIELTERGSYIVSLDIQSRMIELAKIIFSEPIFFNTLNNLSIKEEEFKKWRMGEITAKRRLSSVKNWIFYFNNFFQKRV